MKLFLDLDGVFSDLHSGLNELVGPNWVKQDGSMHLWRKIAEADPRLFRKLKPIEGSLEFLDELRRITRVPVEAGVISEVSVLTAIPRQYHMPYAAIDKASWVEQYMKPIMPYLKFTIGPFACDKKCHITDVDDILIDDSTNNICDWNEAGAKGILHVPEEGYSDTYLIFQSYLHEVSKNWYKSKNLTD